MDHELFQLNLLVFSYQFLAKAIVERDRINLLVLGFFE